MASINHLEMCDQLKALPEIEIKKTCFGLFTQAVYKPSQSVIKVNQHEYSVEVGGQLEKLLNGGNNTIMEQRNKGKKYSKSTQSTTINPGLSALGYFFYSTFAKYQNNAIGFNCLRSRFHCSTQ